MTKQSPTEGVGASVVPEVGIICDGTKTKTSYTEVARRKFPNISLDMEPIAANNIARLSYRIIADVIFDRLKLKREEFMRFQTFKEENGSHSLKIRTTKDIDVKKRFGGCNVFEIQDEEGGVCWKATVRGALEENVQREEKLKLRIINPPEEAAFGEIKAEVEKFAEVKSGVREEVVSVQEEPRLAGCPTGVLSVMIGKKLKVAKIPRYITIRRHRVRIHLALPPNVCLRCLESGHRVASCPEDRVQEEEGENQSGDDELFEEDVPDGEHGGGDEDGKTEDDETEVKYEKEKEEKRGKITESNIVKKAPGGSKSKRGTGTGRGGSRIGLRSTSELPK